MSDGDVRPEGIASVDGDEVDGDETEQWLADFIDWIDTSVVDRTGTSSATEKVDAFLAGCPRVAPRDVRRVLLDFASDDDPIAELTATAVFNWIESAGPSDEESLPQQFGDYTLLEVVGRGGMGIVYRAIQSSLDRPICIKLAPAGMDQRSRLVREAKLAGELHHPNIVSVFDAGVCEGRSFIAMEFVDGQPLSAVLASEPLAANDAAAMLIEICTAVEFAHQAQILHRDLKPSNVIVDRTGRPRVTDFGLAKRLRTSEQPTTETLTGIAGSPSYMAPEQVRDETLTVQTDVYGLGSVLYEMLSGRPPLVGNTPLETMRLVESTEPVELGRLQVGLPRDLETICHKCLEKRRQNRYATVTELKEDLQRFLDDVPVKARPVGGLARATRWVRRNPSVSSAAAVVLISVIATMSAGGWMLSQTRKALTKTTAAEAKQRDLADDLRHAIDVSNDSLYRSLIVQAAQALSADDVPSARRALTEIDSTSSLRSLARIEFQTLRRQSWPALATTPSDSSPVVDFAWNEFDGTLMTATPSGEVKAYTSEGNPQPGERIVFHENHAAIRLAIHPQHNLAAVLTNSAVYCVNLDTRMTDGTVEFAEPMRQIVWHPTMALLIGIAQSGGVWMIEPGRSEMHRLPVESFSHRKVAFSPDGHLMAILGTNVTRVWRWDQLFSEQSLMESARDSSGDVASAVEVKSDQWPIDMTWLRGETLVVLEEHATVNANQFNMPDVVRPSAELVWSLESGLQSPMALCVSGDELLLIGSNQMIGIDGQRGTIAWKQPLPPNARVQTAANRSLIAILEHDATSIQICDTTTFATPQVVATSNVPIRKVVIGNQGKTVAWRNVDGKVSVTNDDWNDRQINFTETTQPGTGLALSPRQDQLAVSRDGTVIFYRLPQLTESHRITTHRSTVWSLCFDVSGRMLASGDSDGVVIVSATSDGKILNTFEGLHGDIRSLVFSSNGRSLFVADGSATIKRCEIDDGRIQSLELIDAATINAITVTDDQWLAAGDSAGRMHLLRLTDSQTASSWTAHTGPVWSLAATRDRILSAAQDGNVRVWDTSGNLLATLADVRQPIWSICDDPVSGRLYGTTTSGNVFRVSR